jgi:hypothetical protein
VGIFRVTEGEVTEPLQKIASHSMATRVQPSGVNIVKAQRRTRPLALLRPLIRALCMSLLVVRSEAMSWAPRLHSTRWIHHPSRMRVVPHRRVLMIADGSDEVAPFDAPPYEQQDSDAESDTSPAVGGLFGTFVQGLFAPVSAEAAAVVDQPIPIPVTSKMDPVQVRRYGGSLCTRPHSAARASWSARRRGLTRGGVVV